MPVRLEQGYSSTSASTRLLLRNQRLRQGSDIRSTTTATTTTTTTTTTT